MTISAAAKGGSGIVGGLGMIKQYGLTLDDSWLAAGEVVDLSDDFSTIDSIAVGGVVAGIGANFIAKIPESGVAVTASNVLMLAYWSTDASGAMTAVPNATDLSACNPLTITVIGKPNIES